MKFEELQRLFADLKVWHGNGRRAPHKPLLALWAIGRCLRNEERLVPYSIVERELGELLRRFGHPTKTVNPDLPFWHLQTSGVWEVPEAERIDLRSSRHAKVSSLRNEGARGGLPAEVFDALQKDRVAALCVASSLLDAHFPKSLHDDILRCVRMDFWHAELTALEEDRRVKLIADYEFERVLRRVRDRAFSKAVVKAYGEKCAVCEYSVRLRGIPVALEAAHIMWHSAGGPGRDKVNNGLSLCALHHRLFDAGAFTVSPEYAVIIADGIGGQGAACSLKKFKRKQILLPTSSGDYPDPQALAWHHEEVFGMIRNGTVC